MPNSLHRFETGVSRCTIAFCARRNCALVRANLRPPFLPLALKEAILDALLINDAGRHIREQFADTGGFTDHVFAACAILGYRFAPRIRDLPSKRLYAFNPSAAPAHLRPLIGGKINQAMIERNWPDILRIGATIAAGSVAPRQFLRKLASYPRQNELATALREVGVGSGRGRNDTLTEKVTFRP